MPLQVTPNKSAQTKRKNRITEVQPHPPPDAEALDDEYDDDAIFGSRFLGDGGGYVKSSNYSLLSSSSHFSKVWSMVAFSLSGKNKVPTSESTSLKSILEGANNS